MDVTSPWIRKGSRSSPRMLGTAGKMTAVVAWFCSGGLTPSDAQHSTNSASFSPPASVVGHIYGNIQTSGEYYLSATKNGGIGGPDSGSGQTALHTDAKTAGPWETFTLETIDSTHFALKTADGHYVTAVNAGGIGNASPASAPQPTVAKPPIVTKQPIVTNVRTSPGKAELFRLNRLSNSQVTIQTSSGRYVTAVNGGGYGGPNDVPIHTNATTIGPWERLTWVPVVKTNVAVCPPEGCTHTPPKNQIGCTLPDSLTAWNSDAQCTVLPSSGPPGPTL